MGGGVAANHIACGQATGRIIAVSQHGDGLVGRDDCRTEEVCGYRTKNVYALERIDCIALGGVYASIGVIKLDSYGRGYTIVVGNHKGVTPACIGAVSPYLADNHLATWVGNGSRCGGCNATFQLVDIRNHAAVGLELAKRGGRTRAAGWRRRVDIVGIIRALCIGAFRSARIVVITQIKRAVASAVEGKPGQPTTVVILN